MRRTITSEKELVRLDQEQDNPGTVSTDAIAMQQGLSLGDVVLGVAPGRTFAAFPFIGGEYIEGDGYAADPALTILMPVEE